MAEAFPTRQFKVTISRYGKEVLALTVTATTAGAALDEAWAAFEAANGPASFSDASFTTKVRTIGTPGRTA